MLLFIDFVTMFQTKCLLASVRLLGNREYIRWKSHTDEKVFMVDPLCSDVKSGSFTSTWTVVQIENHRVNEQGTHGSPKLIFTTLGQKGYTESQAEKLP